MGAVRPTIAGGGSSSSDDEDDDPRRRAAIAYVAAAADFALSASTAPARTVAASVDSDEGDEEMRPKSHSFKLYQIKAQKVLSDLLDKSMLMVKGPAPPLDDAPSTSEGGIRLFSRAPPGIIFDPVDTYRRPTKKPRIVPSEEINERSKKFRHQIQSVAVDGVDILADAKVACQRSLARFEAKEVARKVAIKREEERVAELKRVRGEKWLPSIARDMQATVKNN